MRALSLGISTLALFARFGGTAMGEELTAWRLLVSDHAAPIVHVIDSVEGETLDTFDIEGLASLYRSDSGEAVYAVQGMDGHWSDPRPRVAVAGTGTAHNHAEVEEHAQGHDHDSQVYQGYFEDDQIGARALSDCAGDWPSVYPYLQDGTLDPVMDHKAEHGDKSADEYRAHYETGYQTAVGRITIDGDTVTFFGDGEPLQAQYTSDGFEILTYAKGNRGVRFIFEKIGGDETAPQFIQFSDHKIAPEVADHYHLYWGNDRAALLEQVTNWPTYYPSALSAEEIVDEMMAH